MGPKTGLVPALETKMSMPPNFWRVSSINFSRSCAFPTWQATPATFSWEENDANAVSTLDSFRLLIITLAPSDCSFLAMASPILGEKCNYTNVRIHVFFWLQNDLQINLDLTSRHTCASVLNSSVHSCHNKVKKWPKFATKIGLKLTQNLNLSYT